MQLSLGLKGNDYLTKEEKQEIDKQIDSIIQKHKGNTVEINRLVFESVSSLTASGARSRELAEQGMLKKIWGGLTGKNQSLQYEIDNGLARSQYCSQQTIQKLSEQNLISFELLTAINNKLNSSIIGIENEINKIYGTLITFFKQTKSEIIQLENRVDRLEKNVNLLNWANTIEYQMYNGIEYTELNKIDKTICIVRDFYDITKGNWTTSDLLLLKSALNEIGLSSKGSISYKEFIQHVSENEEMFNKLAGDGLEFSISTDDNNILVLNGLNKLRSLDTSEKYIFDTVKSQLKKHGVDEKDKDLKFSIVESYLSETASININSQINLFDFIIELLFNIKTTECMVSEKYVAADLDFENMEYEKLRVYAEKGNIEAQYNIAFRYYMEDETEIDGADAFRYVKSSADKGNANAQYLLALVYSDMEDEEDNMQQALKYLELSANQDNVEAQNLLGGIYLEGEESCDLKQDYSKAMFWLSKAAEQGNDEAQYNIGEMYYYGNGVDIDYSKALRWILKSAYQGNADAQFRLGYMYFHGQGVPEDYEEAVNWYNKAADQGNALAQNNLGVCYENGDGVEMDYSKAAELYKKAAEQGDDCGECNLGFMYLYGNGVSYDRDEARRWFKKSAEQGYERAKKALRENF